MSCFYNENVYCPKCPPIRFNKRGECIGYPLSLAEDNYSGTGVDVAHCEHCKSDFYVSYKVDKISEIVYED